ncbi:hypothetical protein TrCOL_g12530, partial [Triparma columacea]
RLSYSSTLELFKAAPEQKPLRVKYRTPQAVSASVRARCSTASPEVFQDCIVKVSNFNIYFEQDSTVLPPVALKDELAHVVLTLTASSTPPLLLNLICAGGREISLKFKTFNKLITFAVGLYSNTMLLGGVGCGVSPVLLAMLDKAGVSALNFSGEDPEDCSDVDDEENEDGEAGEGDMFFEGTDGAQQGSANRSVSGDSERDLYSVVDELQQQLQDCEEPLPAANELAALRGMLEEEHRKNIEMLSRKLEAEAKHERTRVEREEKAGREIERAKFIKAEPSKQVTAVSQSQGPFESSTRDTRDSPLKRWKPKTQFSQQHTSFSSMPTLTQIMEGAKAETRMSARESIEVKRDEALVSESRRYSISSVNSSDGTTGLMQPPKTRAKLDRGIMELYGELIGQVLKNPPIVVSAASSMRGDAPSCRAFCRAVVSRLGCRYTSSFSNFLTGVVSRALEMGDQQILFNVVGEICLLPEVLLWARSVTRVSKEDELEGEGSGGREEDVALKLVSNVVQRLVDGGAEGVPDVLVGCLQELSRGGAMGMLSVSNVLSEFVLLKGLKDGGLLGRNPESMVERCLVVFLRLTLGGIAGGGGRMGGGGIEGTGNGGPLTIKMQAKTASLQVKVSKWIGNIMHVEKQGGGGRDGGNGNAYGSGGGLHFDSSFAGVSGKPREMLNLVAVRGKELYLIHSAVEEGSRGGYGDGKIAGVLASLGKADVGLTSVEDRDKALLLDVGGEGWGTGDNSVALQEATWIIQKAKSRLQSIFADKTGALSRVDVKSARQVLSELKDKKPCISVMREEARRLNAAILLSQNYRMCIEESGETDEGAGISFLVENKLLRIIQGELAIIQRMKLLMKKGSGGEEGTGREEKGEKGKGGGGGGRGEREAGGQVAGEKSRGEGGALPTNSLATLLSTVFNPANLE